VMSSALRRLLAPLGRNAKRGVIATPRIREVGFQTEAFPSGRTRSVVRLT
jgi:hypothetical protein